MAASWRNATGLSFLFALIVLLFLHSFPKTIQTRHRLIQDDARNLVLPSSAVASQHVIHELPVSVAQEPEGLADSRLESPRHFFLGPHENNITLESARILSNANNHLSERAPVDDLYDRCLCRGRALVARMHANSQPSQYSTVEQLQTSGWVVTNEGLEPVPDKLQRGFEANGLPIYGTTIKAKQSNGYEAKDGDRRIATNANYDIQIDPDHGSLITLSSYSPTYKIEQEFGGGSLTPEFLTEELPRISRWSDVAWIMWQRYSGPKVGNLKYIWRDNVITQDTKRVMEKAANSGPSMLLRWPGLTFSFDKEEEEERAMALLGTVHGTGIAYFLADHRDHIRKQVESVTIYTNSLFYYMMWKLKDP